MSIQQEIIYVLGDFKNGTKDFHEAEQAINDIYIRALGGVPTSELDKMFEDKNKYIEENKDIVEDPEPLGRNDLGFLE